VNDRVDFFCARPEHHGSEPNDALTMHDELWAYCWAGLGEPHEWRPTGGLSLDDVRRLIRSRPLRPLDTADKHSS
jgi:hypothetical protein